MKFVIYRALENIVFTSTENLCACCIASKALNKNVALLAHFTVLELNEH